MEKGNLEALGKCTAEKERRGKGSREEPEEGGPGLLVMG